MYELVKAGANTYYIDCPVKIGVWRETQTDVYLIDSGGDKDAGRRVLKILNEQGWRLKGILNTHSNADHIGGNRYLQTQTGCAVFAPGAECAITRHTVLEPALLYGGYPFSRPAPQVSARERERRKVYGGSRLSQRYRNPAPARAFY